MGLNGASSPATAAPVLLVPRLKSEMGTLGLNPEAVVPGKPAGDLVLSAVFPRESNCDSFWEPGDGGEVGVFWDLPLSERLTEKSNQKKISILQSPDI